MHVQIELLRRIKIKSKSKQKTEAQKQKKPNRKQMLAQNKMLADKEKATEKPENE